MIRLCAKYTVARLLERDDFSKRFKDGTPISVHELLYPLAQAYDSVPSAATSSSAAPTRSSTCWSAARSSGTTASRRRSSPPRRCSRALDGVNKMSKSLGNYIGITEPPEVMFAQADVDQRRADVPLLRAAHRPEPGRKSRRCASASRAASCHPMDAKMDLARIDRRRLPFAPPMPSAPPRSSTAWCGRAKCPRTSKPSRCPRACGRRPASASTSCWPRRGWPTR